MEALPELLSYRECQRQKCPSLLLRIQLAAAPTFILEQNKGGVSEFWRFKRPHSQPHVSSNSLGRSGNKFGEFRLDSNIKRTKDCGKYFPTDIQRLLNTTSECFCIVRCLFSWLNVAMIANLVHVMSVFLPRENTRLRMTAR